MFSDATNVMKGVRSGVQKLIKDECPSVLDVSCISYLADLTIKAGMKSLPVNIDQLFFYQSSKRKQEFCDLWYSLFTSEPQPAHHVGSVFFVVSIALLLNMMG